LLAGNRLSLIFPKQGCFGYLLVMAVTSIASVTVLGLLVKALETSIQRLLEASWKLAADFA